MEVIMTYVQPFFDWFLQTTLIASVVICLILAAQKTLGGKLGPRWCHALWLVLVIRMVLPWAPSSRISLLNLVPSWDRQIQRQQLFETTEQHDVSQPAQTAGTSEAMPGQKPQSEIAIQERVAPQPRTLADVQSESKPKLVSVRRVLPLLWLAGAMVIGAYLLVSDLALWRIVKRDCPLFNQSMLELFEECKAQMGVQSLVAVVPSSQVRSPGLFGFIRPRLLLPREMLDTATREEMRYVFLHELAHLKRRDIYLGWLTSLLQVLHWFNPIIWFAFYRMRADRELACDALVLTRTGQDKSQEYGGAIVGLLRRFSHSRPLPAMAGILESRSQLKRRITMIARFKKNSYQWSPLAVILIIILACVSLPDAKHTKASGTSAAKPGRHITLRQVWAGPDVYFMGAISPDGRYLSYVDWDTGDLAILEIATGKKRRLTNKGSWDESGEFAEFSRWSPDGKQIVYDWFNDNFMELRIIGLDGSKPRILYGNEEVGWAQTYDWSPDGKQILACFSRKDGPDQIVLVSAADGSVRVLKTLDNYYPKNMSFSPDGRCIVYDYQQKEDLPEHDISLLLTDGSREIRLVEHPANDYVLGWAPDGKNIIFTSDRTGNFDVWGIQVTDGKPQGAPELVKQGIGRRCVPLGFTQKGSFYYGIKKGSVDIYIATLDQKTGKILVPPKKAIKRFEGSNAQPDYSPDGKYLAYVSIRRTMPFITAGPSNPIVLCIYSLETGEEREFSPKLKRIVRPRWSPDCSYIFVGGKDYKGRWGIYQIDTQTGTVTPLVPPPENSRQFTHECSRDGKAFFYGRRSRTNDLSQIMLREIESGTEKELYRASSDDHFSLSCSPDGKWLAFINRRPKKGVLGVLRIMPVTGGEPRELYRFEEEEGLGMFTWTADGKYILFTRKNPKKDAPDWELCRIPAEGGEIEKLGLEMDNIGGLSVHPDGQHIAFATSTDMPAEVWVMENFLPGAPVAKPDHQPNFRKIRIPTKPGNGVLSPDGKKLAFVSKGGIWVVPVHGKVSPDIAGEPVMLPGTEGAWHWGMRWSADGKWIAYNALKNDVVGICIVPSSGGKVKRIVNRYRAGVSIHNYLLSLSPDGKIVAFTSEEKEKIQLLTVNVEGGDVNQLTEDGGTQPTFSPDGKKIAYVKEKPQKTGIHKSDVWVIPAAGGTPVQVSDLPGEARGPLWSPDGKMIAFIGDSKEKQEICIVPVSETGNPEASPTQIELPLATRDFLAGWTPDNKIGVLLTEPHHQAIYTVPASGGYATQVTPQGYTFHPRWSPNGERIYFRWNGGDIASVPSEGGEISIGPLDADSKIYDYEVFPGGGNAVSPDGKKIVFSGAKMVFRDNKKAYEVNIYTIPIEGGEPNKLTISPGQDRFPCWSPDGKKIAFIRYGYAEPSKEMSICIVSTEGGEVRQLTSESHRVLWSDIAWSPDGKSIAYFSEDKAIKVIPVQGGQPRIVVKVEDVSSHSELAWSPDGRKLAYSSKGSIWAVLLDGGEPEEIKTELDAKASHISWSPDGEKIAFTAMGSGDTELWLMENFLPTAVATSGN